MDNNEQKIAELENEISTLPSGSVVKKTVNGKVYYYHRYTENGKRKEKYIDFDLVDEYRLRIERRKALESELKVLKAKIPHEQKNKETKFNALIRTGSDLLNYVQPVKKYKKRECFSKLKDYVYGDSTDRVFILYGLRRTGKTTMIRQLIGEMSEEDLSKTAFIQIARKDTLSTINQDLRTLERLGYTYIFIDEVTLMEDFIEGAALFSDVYATCGIKIVLSGTDSLGFILSCDEELYDRAFMLHTTFIPYREFENVLGIKGIDEYIRYGGTMSLSGVNYNENSVFSDSNRAGEYVDSAIAKNIQHSLKYYQYGGHFRHLEELYDKNELTSAINRVVEDINHRFTTEVLTRDFNSNDLALSARNLRKDRVNPTDILDNIDKENLNKQLKKMLDILNRREQSVAVSEVHAIEIKEYLELLDLIFEIEKFSFSDIGKPQTITVISQPGMRYAQAKALIESLLTDAVFSDLSKTERDIVIARILSEIRGRMMEDIVLLETKLAYPKKQVFKLQFAVGEFDMVVADSANSTCQIYEIKYSTEAVKEQYKHLVDEEKCKVTEHRFGAITGKYVIYRGTTQNEGDIHYLNVEEYLKSL
ncbi:MAG: AAA family ATPase [Clostridia bacterium]|nr:AAA family ATPase [Clostridia bacterium]